MPLMITRKVGQTLIIGDAEITIVKIGSVNVKLAITAPQGVGVLRPEYKGQDPSLPPYIQELVDAVEDLADDA